MMAVTINVHTNERYDMTGKNGSTINIQGLKDHLQDIHRRLELLRGYL